MKKQEKVANVGKALLSVSFGVLAATMPFAADAVSLASMSNNAGNTANAVKSAASLISVAGGIAAVAWGLYQGFVARANDPQIKFGQSMMIAAGGGLMAAIAASTNTFQETLFGTQNNGNQADSSSPF